MGEHLHTLSWVSDLWFKYLEADEEAKENAGKHSSLYHEACGKREAYEELLTEILTPEGEED